MENPHPPGTMYAAWWDFAVARDRFVADLLAAARQSWLGRRIWRTSPSPVIPVILEPGRWTMQREGETPAEAMNRLTEGTDIDSPEVPESIAGMMDRMNEAAPRFGARATRPGS
jgi:hypothetical protein